MHLNQFRIPLWGKKYFLWDDFPIRARRSPIQVDMGIAGLIGITDANRMESGSQVHPCFLVLTRRLVIQDLISINPKFGCIDGFQSEEVVSAAGDINGSIPFHGVRSGQWRGLEIEINPGIDLGECWCSFPLRIGIELSEQAIIGDWG